jgi:hydrogenase assembly chaperone HypC/HupF
MAAASGLSGPSPVTLGPAPPGKKRRQLSHERRNAARAGRANGLTMCIAFPGRVLALDETDAVVEIDGRQRRASLRMRTDVTVGDWVLVGAGSVVRRLEADEAAQLISTLRAAIASTDARLAAMTQGGSS